MRFPAHSDEQLDCWLANEAELDCNPGLAGEDDGAFLERMEKEIPENTESDNK